MGEEASAGAVVRARVVKRFHHKTVLDNASIAVGAGECVAVVGANGAGKTTLLRILAGLEEPDEGFVERRARVVYVPEIDFLPRFTRVGDWFQAHGCPSPGSVGGLLGVEAGRLVEGFWGRRLGGLSKGQRRLMGLLAALCGFHDSGSVVLLDEPYAGLAAGYRGLVAEASRATEAAVVASFHSVEEALEFTGGKGRLYVLEEGRLVEARPSSVDAVRVRVERGDTVEETIADYEALSSTLYTLYATGFPGVRRVCIEPLGRGEAT